MHSSEEKKRRTQLKRKRLAEAVERIKWSKKHGHDTYFGGSDVEMAVRSTPAASEYGNESMDDLSDSSMCEEVLIDICVCGAEGRAHKRGCPLSYRNRLPGRTLFPPPNNPGGHADPSPLEPEHVWSPRECKTCPFRGRDARDESWGLCLHSQQKHG